MSFYSQTTYVTWPSNALEVKFCLMYNLIQFINRNFRG